MNTLLLRYAAMDYKDSKTRATEYHRLRDYDAWSWWMRQAKRDKEALRKHALSLHWVMYLTGKTAVKPKIDLALLDMPVYYRSMLASSYLQR